MSYHVLDGLGRMTLLPMSSSTPQFSTMSPASLPLNVSDINRAISSGERGERVAAANAAKAAKAFKPWSSVVAPYLQGINQFILALGEWGVNMSDALPGSGGVDTGIGFVDNNLKKFIAGDVPGQYLRIINRLQDLATNPQPTPDRMRQVAGSLLAQTKAIYEGVYNGSLFPGVDVDPNPPPSSAPPPDAGVMPPVALDPALLATMRDYSAPKPGLPSWALPVGIAALVGGILMMRRRSPS